MRLALWSPRMTGYSGVELWTLTLGIALAKIGHAVSVHAPTWEEHLSTPLRAVNVECRDWDSWPDGISANLTPKYGPYKAAINTGRPLIQVLHSEHLTDVPIQSSQLVGVVMIRAGQRWLIETEPWAKTLPRKLIRNPVDFARFGDTPAGTRRDFDGVLISEFDDMKVKLAAEFQQKIDGRVLLVGPWRSDFGVPDHCYRRDMTLDVAPYYQQARVACSYRLSRTLPEGLACGCTIYVRGGLEPEKVTCHDNDGDWSIVEPGQLDLAPFAAEKVAQEMVDFVKECCG